jgi:DNA-binding transcriptional LysR family regulator
VDLRLLELLCRVYKARSFSRVARELGLTQPTTRISSSNEISAREV